MESATQVTDGAWPFDRTLRATLAKLTLGISPASAALATLDWSAHLATAPSKQLGLATATLRGAVRLGGYAVRSARDRDAVCPIEPPRDRRFRDPAWRRWPFNVVHQSYLLGRTLADQATRDIPGLSPHHQHVISFATRQLVEACSPANGLLTNPEVLRATVEQRGRNLVRGLRNWLDDHLRSVRGAAPAGAESFRVGEQVAATPGKVIYRNRLMELIQYSPTTAQVWKEPVLLVPAWMMKYYILDLSPDNSLVKYMVDQGFTVFVISWKNPGPADRDLAMDDYRRLGVLAALDAIGQVVPDTRVHAVGYCLGGIVLTIAAAAMDRDGDRRLASVTTFTTLTDFSEPGDIAVFVDPSEVLFVEDMMWEQGFLLHMQAAASFRLLRAGPLIWEKMVGEYLLGQRQPMLDLMAWNADGTRMPRRMHGELLRRLFLDNDLHEGRYQVDGRPIVVGDIRAPMFTVAAKSDHVAPWKSVYKLHLQSRAPSLSFCLTNGGHNVGIVNPPGAGARGFRIAESKPEDRYVDADRWLGATPEQEGSWWPVWLDWLGERSSGKEPPPPMGNRAAGLGPLVDAPGTYVHAE